MAENDGVIAAVEGADAAAGKAGTSALAQKMAAAIAQATGADGAAVVKGTGGVVAGTEGADAAAGAVVEDVSEVAATPSEIEQLLTDAGIDLDVDLKTLPPQIVERMTDMAQDMLDQRAAAQEANDRLEEFGKQIKDSPDKLLLAMAVNYPEVFKQVIATFTAMETDTNVRDLVIRELQTEARSREADRKERSFNAREAASKAQRVIAATKRAARQNGVSYDIAERVIAMAVKANGGNLEPNAVNEIVSQLRVRPKTKSIITPAAAAAAKTAPNTEVGGNASAGVVQDGASKGLTKTTPHGRFRNLISQALSRTRPAQQ